jgi:hypothetical protein
VFPLQITKLKICLFGQFSFKSGVFFAKMGSADFSYIYSLKIPTVNMEQVFILKLDKTGFSWLNPWTFFNFSSCICPQL